MTDDNNITKAAHHMIERYGDKALKEADLRITELREQEQIETFELWIKIRETLKFQISQSDNETRH
ncbi:MAG: hypothetical protein GY742_04885 [Hyphomicrobiales bacterium]|nr:hypothetical protein [Hyphomicrobiales bacterium]